MKVWSSIKLYALRVWHSQALKYVVVCIGGIAFVGFIGENSYWSHLQNRQRIKELTEEKDVYDAANRRDRALIRELERDPKAMEKIARERYFMKADDEDIFILSDDDRTPQQVMGNEDFD